MKKYSAAVHINASPEKIWEVLADGTGYPEWDVNMDRVEGEIKLGESVKFFTKLQPDQAFPAKVSEFTPFTKMVFTGGMPLGLFKSVRTHTLTPAGDGVDFSTQEEFSGLLLPVFGANIPDLDPIFADFAKGLKQRAEMK